MPKFTKEEREQAKQRLRDMCRECAPDGTATLLIVHTGGRPSSNGRSDYFNVEVLNIYQGRPAISAWLNRNLHMALGYRMAKDGALMVPGCGYNKAHHIASDLAHLCQHPVQVEGSYRGVVR